jgi:hypothetical protein
LVMSTHLTKLLGRNLFLTLPFYEYPIFAYWYLYAVTPSTFNLDLLIAAVVLGALCAAFVKLSVDEAVRDVLGGKLSRQKAQDLTRMTKRVFGRSTKIGIPMMVLTVVTFFFFVRSLWAIYPQTVGATGLGLFLVGLAILAGTLFIPVYFNREVLKLWRWVMRGRRW